MSHQSGIHVSEDLSKVFADAVASGNIRILCISIVEESLQVKGTSVVENDFESDYKKYIDGYLDSTTPSYILVRFDEKSDTTGEYKWLFLCYVPDEAKVRDKMLYASTRATLTRELGDYRFSDSIYGNEKSEFTWNGYKKHLVHKNAEAPLTRRERELVEIKAAEAATVSDYQGTATRKRYVPGVTFPLTVEAIEALCELTKTKNRAFNFVSLHLDNEEIVLDQTRQVSVDELSNTISATAPRFTFYIHQHGSDESLVFIYTCPSSSKIRERMLYSSSKANVITAAEDKASLRVVKKFETSDLSDLTSEYFEELNQQQPSTNSNVGSATNSMVGDRIQMLGGAKHGFKRPVAPGRRRPAAATSSSSTTSTANTTSLV